MIKLNAIIISTAKRPQKLKQLRTASKAHNFY